MSSLWDRTGKAFEKILEDSRKATDKVVDTVEELGDKAKARIEKSRLERSLLKRFAELGNRVYELSKASPAPNVLEDGSVKTVLASIDELEREHDKAESQLGKS